MTRIRTAQLSDAKQLAALAETTFRDTFAEHNTADDMTAHCESTYGEDIQAQEILTPEFVTLVAEHDDRLVAYAQLRWDSCPECVPAISPGEIQRLYVDSAWHGKGLAHELMSMCLALMEERDTDFVWLGVWEANPRAITFYKKFNFREVGEHVFVVGSDPQRDLILARPTQVGNSD